MWLSDDKVVPMQLITDEQLAKIVDSLRSPDDLDDHWVLEFLQRAAARRPELVLDLAKVRLEDALVSHNWRKHPIGIVGRHQKPLGLCAHERGPLLLRGLLDWALPRIDDPLFAHCFADVVHGLFDICDDACFAVLQAWLAGGGKQSFMVLAAIMRDASASFVPKHSHFIEWALCAARAVDSKTHRTLTSALFASAISGTRAGAPGKPFPADLEMKAQAETKLAYLSRGDAAHALYDQLRRYAVYNIERQVAEGRLMDELDADE
jgi:hypothetical protein